ncbi:hypothetical protein KIL84_020036 [Mauremys mutica]|uniref:Uncharacterized protein n=1 Tax=Mauremys mutica TaxID=74926 RepID=A0A9D4B3V6_9SAUR|nr:hypothetical protein KIL84_020036 [Mauremys mutica]
MGKETHRSNVQKSTQTPNLHPDITVSAILQAQIIDGPNFSWLSCLILQALLQYRPAINSRHKIAGAKSGAAFQTPGPKRDRRSQRERENHPLPLPKGNLGPILISRQFLRQRNSIHFHGANPSLHK